MSIASDQAVAGHPGLELVPPAGVATWIVCEQAGTGFRCHDLAAGTGVAVGTPIYRLQPSTDWRAVPRPKSQPYEITKLVQAVLRRPPTAAELRLLIDVLTLGVHSTGPRNPGQPVTTATP